MIEPIMFFVLGCLAASLFSLVLLPLVHARAVRLTTRRLEGAIPVSITEIQADKDQLRAEFAMATRRLELSLDQTRARAASQAAEVGRKLETISRLKAELEHKTVSIAALEVRDKPLLEQVQKLEEDLKYRGERLERTEKTLAEKEAALKKTLQDLEERSLAVDSHRIELVAANTQVATLKDQLQSREKELADANAALVKETAALTKAARELVEHRTAGEKAEERAARLERELNDIKGEKERLGKKVYELETQVLDQTRRLTDATGGRDQVAAQLEAAQKLEADLRREIADAQTRHASEIQTLMTEKELVQSERERYREERGKLKREVAAVKRELESTGAEERAQNALLRESISDMAAEMVRLTSMREGAGSPIATILSDQSAPPMAPSINGQEEANGASVDPPKRPARSLADRIRKLQSRSSQATSHDSP